MMSCISKSRAAQYQLSHIAARSLSAISLDTERNILCTPALLNSIVALSKRPRKGVLTDIYYDDYQFGLSAQNVRLRTRSGQFEVKWLKTGNNPKLDEIKMHDESGLVDGVILHEKSTEWADVCEVLQCVTDYEFDSDITNPSDQLALVQERGINPTASMKNAISNYTMKLEVLDAIARIDVRVEDIQFVPIAGVVTPQPITPQNCKYKILAMEIQSIRNFNYGYAEFWDVIYRKFGISASEPTRGAFMEYMYRFQPDHYKTLIENSQEPRKSKTVEQ